MNSNNNNENHEIAVCQHLNGRFAHSSVLFRLTYLLLLRYYISGKTMFIKVKLLLFYYVINRNWTTSTKEACVSLLPVLVASRAIAIDKCQTAKKKAKLARQLSHKL